MFIEKRLDPFLNPVGVACLFYYPNSRTPEECDRRVFRLNLSLLFSFKFHFAHVKSMCDYFCESSHHVGFKSSLAHSLYMSHSIFL